MPIGPISGALGIAGGEGGIGFGDFADGDLSIGPIRVDSDTMTGGGDLAKMVPVLVIGAIAVALILRSK